MNIKHVTSLEKQYVLEDNNIESSLTEVATRKRRLEHVACVHGTFSLSKPKERVHFINKEYDSAMGIFDFFQDSFETLFKIASELQIKPLLASRMQRVTDSLGLRYLGS